MVQASPTNANAPGGIFTAAQTKNTGSAPVGAIGIISFALNNNAAGPGGGPQGAWASYFECDITINNPNGSPCFDAELEIGNYVSNAYAGTPDPYGAGSLTDLQVGCGSGTAISTPTRM